MSARSPQPVPVTVEPDGLKGLLRLPEDPLGVVIFAHGSGSGRLSPRNNHVAAGLHDEGLATLLIDLLTPIEEADRANVFDIPLLASRLAGAVDWIATRPELSPLPAGYFGARRISAVVSRGGRPDLAGPSALADVHAPTLLIVGSRDESVIELNRGAMRHMRCKTELVIVPGATHLFEEPGTLDQVIAHAARWFVTHFTEA
jgi:pimeloyl-ACP methyl ester carboxylesterase